jgi:hypothetical protein
MPSFALGGIRRFPTLLALVVAVTFAAWLGSAADGQGKPGNAEHTRPGRIPGRPPGSWALPTRRPPSRSFVCFRISSSIIHPLLITRYPGGNRLIVGEQSGVLYSFADSPNAKADLFLDLPRELKTIRLLAEAKGVEAVCGLAFHPDFERNVSATSAIP